MKEHPEYNKLPACCLVADKAIPFDIYINHNGKTSLWRKRQTELNQKDIHQLDGYAIKYIYIGFNDNDKYLEYTGQNIQGITTNENTALKFKSSILEKVTKSILEDISKHTSYKRCVKQLESIVKPTVELVLSTENVNTVRFLVEKGDIVFSYIPHSARTCYYTVALAKMFNTFSNEKLYQLGVGTLLHDIGQTMVSTQIREKIGKYTDEERIEMERHPVYSAELIHRSKLFKLDTNTLIAIKSHHESGDKTGYPNHLSLFDLPLEAGILAITHTFDSHTTEKIHREAKKPYDVIKYMLTNTKKYPEEIVQKFIKLLGKLEKKQD